MTTAYIAGEMTSKKDFNFELFDKVARGFWLAAQDMGVELCIVNPSHLSMRLGTQKDYKEYLRVDIRALMDCDVIVMLPGWQNSDGATFEYEVAKRLGIGVFLFEDYIEDYIEGESIYIDMIKEFREYINGKDSNY